MGLKELMAGPAECIHQLTITNHYGRKVGCEVCADGPGPSISDWLVKASRPDGKPKAHKDADLELAQLVAEGLICPSCLLPYDPIGGVDRHRRERDQRVPIGCECQRRAQHDQHRDMVDYWLGRDDVVAEFEGADRKRTAIASMAFTSYARTARRAAIAPDERAADRLDIVVKHEVEPKWSPMRVNEADTLPV